MPHRLAPRAGILALLAIAGCATKAAGPAPSQPTPTGAAAPATPGAATPGTTTPGTPTQGTGVLPLEAPAHRRRRRDPTAR